MSIPLPLSECRTGWLSFHLDKTLLRFSILYAKSYWRRSDVEMVLLKRSALNRNTAFKKRGQRTILTSVKTTILEKNRMTNTCTTFPVALLVAISGFGVVHVCKIVSRFSMTEILNNAYCTIIHQ